MSDRLSTAADKRHKSSIGSTVEKYQAGVGCANCLKSSWRAIEIGMQHSKIQLHITTMGLNEGEQSDGSSSTHG